MGSKIAEGRSGLCYYSAPEQTDPEPVEVSLKRRAGIRFERMPASYFSSNYGRIESNERAQFLEALGSAMGRRKIFIR